jgi:oligopeptide transport system substrate-binding protein
MRPPLDDVRVRRALALAIDRQAVVANITRAGQAPAFNFCPPSDAFVSRARLQGDLDEARRLLAEAGFPEGRGFPRMQLLFNTSENHRAIAEAIQQMWRRELGIEIALTNQEWKVYLDAQDTLNYDISRAGWIGDYPDPATFMDMWVTRGGNNDTGWSHPDYDRLLAASQEAPDDTTRFERYHQMDELLMREMPVIPIYFYTRPYALDPKVHWVPNILDNRNWKFVEIAD